MNFKRLKVSTQLALGFGAMTVLIALAGLLGIYNSSRAVDYLRTVTLRDVEDEVNITKIRSLMEVNRSQVLQALQHNPGTEYSKWHDHPTEIHYKVAAETTEALKRIWARYEADIHTPEEKRLAADWYNRSGGLGMDNVHKAMAAIEDDHWADAQATLIKGINPAYRNGDAALQALSEFFKKRTTLDSDAVNDALARNRDTMLGLLAVSLLIAGSVVFVLVRKFSRELGGEPSYARTIANRIAQGDLSQRIALQRNDRDSVLFAMSAMQSSLVDVATKVRLGSESVSAASTEIARGNRELSARTGSQACALEQTAASMEELASTVKKNADNARLANQMAQGAAGVAEQGGAVVSQVVDKMRGISEGARKISDIIGVIDSIAFQTNILALNAAVEAARAGEQGRGFAVVAAEVRTLAGRSAEAAKEIRGLILASVKRVDEGSALVDQAGTTMTEVVGSIKRVTDIMGEISVACSEQSTGVAQVGEAVVQIDQVTQQNVALVEEMAGAASSLSGQAQQLVQAVAIFQLDGMTPLTRVPSAPAARSSPRQPAMTVGALAEPMAVE